MVLKTLSSKETNQKAATLQLKNSTFSSRAFTKVSNCELPLHWWCSRRGARGGPNCLPPPPPPPLHTFIQVFHYILRAGGIPQECTRQHLRTGFDEDCLRLILVLCMKKGTKLTTIGRAIDRSQLTTSTLALLKRVQLGGTLLFGFLILEFYKMDT